MKSNQEGVQVEVSTAALVCAESVVDQQVAGSAGRRSVESAAVAACLLSTSSLHDYEAFLSMSISSSVCGFLQPVFGLVSHWKVCWYAGMGAASPPAGLTGQ
eukprot:363309-Chlamydomonas_euryale.AAC.35